MNEVKGGLVIQQLKEYAIRLSDYSGESAHIGVCVWSHIYQEQQYFEVEIKAGHMSSEFIVPRFKTEDLRELGNAIDDYIEGNTKNEKGELKQ